MRGHFRSEKTSSVTSIGLLEFAPFRESTSARRCGESPFLATSTIPYTSAAISLANVVAILPGTPTTPSHERDKGMFKFAAACLIARTPMPIAREFPDVSAIPFVRMRRQFDVTLDV